MARGQNLSKQNCPHLWAKWRRSGAIGRVISRKTVVMPSREEILRRLRTVTNEAHMEENFFPLVMKAAGTQLNSIGVVNLLTFAIADYTEGLPPMIYGLIARLKANFVTALVDDEIVRDDALYFLKQIDKAVAKDTKKRIAAQPPVKPRKVLTAAEETALYAAARKIAAIYDETCGGGASDESRRQGGANPYYDQCENGLYIEWYYSSPHDIWTPWGKWTFTSANTPQESLKAFMSRLTLEIHMATQNTTQGTIGPVYAVKAIDGVPLPEPKAINDRRQYLEYGVAKSIWGRLEKEWYAANNIVPPMSSEEKRSRDMAILLARGEREPKPLQPGDITSLDDLLPYAGQIVKYTEDDGKTWRYTKLSRMGLQEFQGGVEGIAASEEVLPHMDLHGMYAMTGDRFEERGTIVRPVLDEKEYEDIKFSYDFDRNKEVDARRAGAEMTPA